MHETTATLSSKNSPLKYGALLVISYAVLLWMTANSRETTDTPKPVYAAPQPETHAANPQPQVTAQNAAHEIVEPDLPTETPFEENLVESEAPPPPMIQSATTPQADALLRSATGSGVANVEILARAIEPNNDRETRLAAVNALLVLGRKAMVDAEVIAALKRASQDMDRGVAAEANSALAEVERVTH